MPIKRENVHCGNEPHCVKSLAARVEYSTRNNDGVVYAVSRDGEVGTSVHDAMKLMSRLNPGNLHILRVLLPLLSDVANTATSKMNAETLGTSLFCMLAVADRAAKAAAIVPSPSPSPDLSAIAKCNRFISLLIENAHKVAEEPGNLLSRKTT